MDQWTLHQTAEIIQRIFAGPAVIKRGQEMDVCIASTGLLARGKDGVYESCAY